MTADPDEESTPWRLPSYIWLDTARRAWLEAAEKAWIEGYTEGYEQSLQRSRAQSVVLQLFYWRGIDVPDAVRRKVRATTDLNQLRTWRDRAYEVTDPADLFADADEQPA